MQSMLAFIRAVCAVAVAAWTTIGLAQITPVVEYYNATLDHYFVTADPVEIGDLDAGRQSGWARTGLGFTAYAYSAPGANPVCRFYIPPALGDSHVFTASPAECAEAQVKFPQFILESAAAFYIPLPDVVSGACPTGTIAVYRLWNGRADSNHRYTVDPTIRDAMVRAGYVAEGYGPDAVTMCSPTSSPASPQASGIAFAGPLHITSGGTYSGNWESQDPAVPAILVDTLEPVSIEHCTLRGRANLISAGRAGVDVTVRHCRGYGLDSGVAGQERGAFFEAYRVAQLTFEHNYMEGLFEGIVLIEYGGLAIGTPPVVIRYNRARNLMGLYSDGQGGVQLHGDLGNEGNGNHWVIINKLQQIPGAEISWNEVVSDPYLSSVGDKINLYQSSGTTDVPIVVHDNFMRGGYGIIPTLPEYSGSGVITDGSKGDSEQSATAFVKIHDNQFVSIANFGAGAAAGHDIEIYNNRAVSTGMFGNGIWMAAPYGNGFVVWNGYNQSSFRNNSLHDNVAGWVVELTDGSGNRVEPPVRHDFYVPDCAGGGCTGNVSLADPITATTEDNEYLAWLQKLAGSGITIGPISPVP
jgi:hypothetical protein